MKLGPAPQALRAAESVAADCAAIDVNMGCAKHFALRGNMGAALLKAPEAAADIVSTLRRNLSVPVSCKVHCRRTPSPPCERNQVIRSVR